LFLAGRGNGSASRKGRGVFSRDTHQNFTPTASGLSVTVAAGGRDNVAEKAHLKDIFLGGQLHAEKTPLVAD
jgi:hypothetical protein